MFVQNDAEKNQCVPLHLSFGREKGREEYKKKEEKQEARVVRAQSNKRVKGKRRRSYEVTQFVYLSKFILLGFVNALEIHLLFLEIFTK